MAATPMCCIANGSILKRKQELHLFQSKSIWFDPSDHIQSDKVKVFIEVGNPHRHLVDLSFLPKVAA